MSDRIQGLELSYDEWLTLIQEQFGAKKFVTDQICQWIYQKKVFDWNGMTNLSKDLRAALAERVSIVPPVLVERQISADGTKKYLWELSDGARVESVLMDHGNHLTACLSSQVGCPLKCAFCATGRGGFERNMTAGEIVGHFLAMEADLGKPIGNVVFMGMGEPLLNFVNVERAIRCLLEPKMRGMGVRHVTISTAGVADGIRKLADSGLGVYLCLSLHAPNDELRSRLMPINERYPLPQVLDALKYWQGKTGVRLTVEYVLIKGVTDLPELAYELPTLFSDLQTYVNLIPYNPVIPSFSRPSASRIEPFAKILRELGMEVEVRREKGTDIDAACGQLRAKKDRPGERETRKR